MCKGNYTASNAQTNAPFIRHPPFRRDVRIKLVHFSSVVQVREIVHRNDMSPSELWDRWGMDPAEEVVDPSIFDSDHAEEGEVGREQKQWNRLRRREAYLIRRQFLCEWDECRRKGVDFFSGWSTYSYYSRLKALHAHNAALLHWRALEEPNDHLPESVDRTGRFERTDAPCGQRRLAVEEASPCVPAKRPRLTI